MNVKRVGMNQITNKNKRLREICKKMVNNKS